MGLFRRRRRQRDRGDAWAGLLEKDRLVLEQLEAHGADLREPRHVLHFLVFADERARAAAAEATEDGWSVQVREPDEQVDDWSLVCERHDVVLEPEVVRRTTDRFGRIAASHGGDYDGWEASV